MQRKLLSGIERLQRSEKPSDREAWRVSMGGGVGLHLQSMSLLMTGMTVFLSFN